MMWLPARRLQKDAYTSLQATSNFLGNSCSDAEGNADKFAMLALHSAFTRSTSSRPRSSDVKSLSLSGTDLMYFFAADEAARGIYTIRDKRVSSSLARAFNSLRLPVYFMASICFSMEESPRTPPRESCRASERRVKPS
eukprot:jgi/Mesvir1/14594/Mv26247-RA.1